MRFQTILKACMLITSAYAKVLDRLPLSYAQIPEGTYEPANLPGEITLLDFIKSRDELSELSKVVTATPGFSQAFATSVGWPYTFFAPSNTAFNNTGQYYETFAATPKGLWWQSQMLQHHYIPNSRLYTSNFTTEKTRIQMGSYLYTSTQVKDGKLVLNNAATVVDSDIPVTNGVIHIIDRILAGDAMLYETDIKRTPQGFIAGSCSDPTKPYC